MFSEAKGENMKKLSHWLASAASALVAFASSAGNASATTTPEHSASSRSEAASGIDSITVSESAKRQLSRMAKGTKYCNLRLHYCYEFPDLGDKSRMRLEPHRLLFENIKRSIAELAVEDINFIWHGGEPLLVPLEFYEQLALIEKDVFGSQFS